jgi:tetratricopeptide (TPR) repeat protein
LSVRTIFVIAISLAAWAGAALADDARAHWKQGTAAYALGHYAEAAAEYEKAYELHPDSALLYNAAQAHRLAGNKSRALLLYQSYLRLYDKAPNRDEVQKFVVQLKAAIATEHEAATAPPTGTAPGEPPGTATTPGQATAATTPAAATLTAAAPEKPRKSRAWVWGVVAGAVVAVGVGLGVGLGIGLSKPARDPSPSYGAFSW